MGRCMQAISNKQGIDGLLLSCCAGHCNQGSAWHACVPDPCYALAELRRLGNTTFVNTHDTSSPGCLEQAMSEGHVVAVEMMMSCGASPGKQGSTWASFLEAATASFTPAKAALIHRLLRHKPTFEVGLLPDKGWQRQYLLCMHLRPLCHLCCQRLLRECGVCAESAVAKFGGLSDYQRRVQIVMEARS